MTQKEKFAKMNSKEQAVNTKINNLLEYRLFDNS